MKVQVVFGGDSEIITEDALNRRGFTPGKEYDVDYIHHREGTVYFVVANDSGVFWDMAMNCYKKVDSENGVSEYHTLVTEDMIKTMEERSGMMNGGLLDSSTPDGSGPAEPPDIDF